MAKIEHTIQKLKAQLANAEQRKENEEAHRLDRLTRGTSKEDTRRKILAGAAVLEMIKSDEVLNQRFSEMLDGFLKRADERELFGLPAGRVKSTDVR